MSTTPTNQGSLRLFRLAGIDLYLHWSWFIVAFFEINLLFAIKYINIAWSLLVATLVGFLGVAALVHSAKA